jgi:hypothetical protein
MVSSTIFFLSSVTFFLSQFAQQFNIENKMGKFFVKFHKRCRYEKPVEAAFESEPQPLEAPFTESPQREASLVHVFKGAFGMAQKSFARLGGGDFITQPWPIIGNQLPPQGPAWSG